LLALLALLCFGSCARASSPENTRLVVMLFPEANDGRPGNLLVDQALRATFRAGSSEHVEIHNDYLDISRFSDADYQRLQIALLRRKYAGRKIDLVIAGLASALDFALEHRETLFPGVPIVCLAVDEQEVKARKLPPDVIGIPIKMDLAGTLDVALRLHPNTQRVYVIAGKASFDAYWEAEARRTFRAYENRVEFVYLSGLSRNDLLREVAHLPERSLIYYLHVLQDDTGKPLVPAEVLELLSATANAPIYGHVNSYVGRGMVGGSVFRFETAGEDAARLGLRILAGEKPETIGIQETTPSIHLFDWRQLKRWGLREESLPPGSVVRYKEAGFWDLYKWHIIGVLSLCLVEALLIFGLLVERANRRRSETALRESHRELRDLTGKLLQAQETERRRIARELHDDLSQSLALLSVQMDLLGQQPPGDGSQLGGRMQEMSDQVKQLSSTVHDLSHRLHPAKLEQVGLVPAVRALCKEPTGSHPLQIEFSHDQVPEAIPRETALCLYRIVQEALRNVVKHSGARHVGVELRGTGEAIRLRIADDGAGFDPGAVDGKGGLGLVSMRERLRLVGGALAIDSRPSGGTRIDVQVPLCGPGQGEDGSRG
jgi:signal transduction histidine kinase